MWNASTKPSWPSSVFWHLQVVRVSHTLMVLLEKPQVTCGMEAKASDRALVAQGDSFVLKIC